LAEEFILTFHHTTNPPKPSFQAPFSTHNDEDSNITWGAFRMALH